MIEIERCARIDAAPEAVWEIVADHDGMAAWVPIRESVRRRPGIPEPNGVGAVRVLRGMGLALEERITVFKPGERLEYALLAGAPVRDHRGEIRLARDGDGTRVHWHVRLRPLVPGTGWLVRRSVDRLVRRALQGLARLAESR